MDYFKRTFPGATTIIFQDNELNQYISIPSDESGHFRFDWDPTVVYELVYRDESSNRSTSPSSSTSRIWNLLTIAGSVAIMWLGSIIASLWSNVYEDVFKILSYGQLSNTQSVKLYFTTRIIILLIFSTLCIVLMECVTVLFIKLTWNKIKDYFQSIGIENLRYNAPSPIPLTL
ncbi:unnamed protein product [Rotaria socialis]|uniref:Uncharacterized protein n=2 Tax=Rotaria socialis TaxID=392032 RepID=A0A817KZH2_9BILA|nr:unnamed protein product [Rotaria socialis]CAF3198532.1 unnamed protein product [Rotaria socialis]CAF4113248.1 unnamed protein product [Rotaria socialis]CAF4476086.1 unnamed protein product [Rotaria socialis]